jgi:hypothetical protein
VHKGLFSVVASLGTALHASLFLCYTTFLGLFSAAATDLHVLLQIITRFMASVCDGVTSACWD